MDDSCRVKTLYRLTHLSEYDESFFSVSVAWFNRSLNIPACKLHSVVREFDRDLDLKWFDF